MRILVLGGSLFLSREVVLAALARGHEVVCACRGSSGAVPEGATHVVLDRAADADPQAGPWVELAGGGYDSVVEVARTPSWVRTALTALSARPHWVFVSTISVYADLSRRGAASRTPRCCRAPPATRATTAATRLHTAGPRWPASRPCRGLPAGSASWCVPA